VRARRGSVASAPVPETPAADAPTAGPGQSVLARGAVLLGLASVAVTQPLLDVFGRNPEFFVAGRYSSAQIIAFAVVVAFAPAAVGTALVGAATAVNQRAGTFVYWGLVAVFAAALVGAILRTADVDSTLAFLGAVVVGGALAVLMVRRRGGHLLASYLAVAGVFFTGTFLFASPTAALVRGEQSGDLGRVELPVPPGPVVWIVLDEFPIATILDADGEINAARYPGFAELATLSTWYRNASSPHNLTHRAVPAQLTGVISDGDTLPRYQDHPRSLFTLLGTEIPISRYESVTDLCPPRYCDPGPRRSLGDALTDSSVVYGHRVLPAAWRAELPAIDNSWGEFGAEDDTGTRSSELTGQDLVEEAYAKWRELGADEKSPLGQAGLLREQIEAITAEPSLHFVHVALPHRPWTLSPSGLSTSHLPELITDPDAPGYEWGAQLDAQLNAMQVGAADVMIGELLDHLRSLPSWSDTLLVVTSDHGTNLTPPDLGRMNPSAANREEVYRVPLFVKAPGQMAGERSDTSASTIDILPTVIDLLGGDVDWEFDGHSLVDGSRAGSEPKVSTSVDPLLEIAARVADRFPHGDDWVGVAAVGAHGDLVGADVADLAVGAPSSLSARLEQSDLFAELPTTEGTMPFVIAGVLSGRRAPESELVVAINGRLAGALGGFRPVEGGLAFNGYVADFYRTGANEVVVYEVEGAGATAVLHPVTTT